MDAGSYLDMMQALGCDLSLINLTMGRIGLGKVHFSMHQNSAAPDDIVLISGSLDYI
jgi:hypothetical protein